MDTHTLQPITVLADNVARHIDNAWKASMTNEAGQINQTEMIHQFDLAKKALEQLNALVWPQEISFIASEAYGNYAVMQQAQFNDLGKDVD